MPRKERARISITGARPVREGPDRPCPTVPATKATERRSWLELGVGSEAVVYARGGKADAEDGIAFGEPVGELLADAGLDFGHAVGGRALPFFKFSYLENGRTLARHHDGRYEFLLSFLSEEQRARAKENIDKNVIAAKAPAHEVPATLAGWQPWGRVLPQMVLQSVSLQGAGDAELTESQGLGLLTRQEIDPEGDYVIPNLTPEEAAYWRQVRDRKKQ